MAPGGIYIYFSTLYYVVMRSKIRKTTTFLLYFSPLTSVMSFEIFYCNSDERFIYLYAFSCLFNSHVVSVQYQMAVLLLSMSGNYNANASFYLTTMHTKTTHYNGSHRL
jgi:hypothetical protein